MASAIHRHSEADRQLLPRTENKDFPNFRLWRTATKIRVALLFFFTAGLITFAVLMSNTAFRWGDPKRTGYGVGLSLCGTAAIFTAASLLLQRKTLCIDPPDPEANAGL